MSCEDVADVSGKLSFGQQVEIISRSLWLIKLQSSDLQFNFMLLVALLTLPKPIPDGPRRNESRHSYKTHNPYNSTPVLISTAKLRNNIAGGALVKRQISQPDRIPGQLFQPDRIPGTIIFWAPLTLGTWQS
jgi:hypothetical protein